MLLVSFSLCPCPPCLALEQCEQCEQPLACEQCEQRSSGGGCWFSTRDQEGRKKREGDLTRVLLRLFVVKLQAVARTECVVPPLPTCLLTPPAPTLALTNPTTHQKNNFSSSSLTLSSHSVYTVGLYTTDDKLSQLKKLTTSADRAKSLSGNGVALLLTFQREVDNASLRGAFLAALGEGGVSYNRDRDTLLAALTTPFSPTGTFAAKTVSATSTASSTSGAVPQAKYQKADTIEFTYQGASKLTVVVNGKHIKSIDSGATSSALRSKLMEVYVGKEAVTPELLPSLETLLV